MDSCKTKVLYILEKATLIMLLSIVILLFACYKNLLNMKHQYDYITTLESKVSYQTKQINDIEKYNSDMFSIHWIDYTIWLKQCATLGNTYIYNYTNYLNMISIKSQDELDVISKKIKITKGNKNYNKLVKFIVIDKRRGTFLTNDMENINTIKKNISSFLNTDDALYNYVFSKGKWFNITYNTDTAPLYTNKIKDPKNFIQAYWFPKNYIYSKDDNILLKDILQSFNKEIENELNINKKGISHVQQNIKGNKIKLTYSIAIIIIILIVLLSLGKTRLLTGVKNSYLVKLLISINNWFDNRKALFKITFYILSSSLFLILLYIMFNMKKSNPYLSFICIIYVFLILPKIFIFSKQLDKVINGADQITNGNLDYTIDENGDKSLKRLAKNINKLNKGFKISIEDQIKNERLKSELIANVSHDLKTPLTSIINYTDILLREDISEKEKEDFIKILNKKSLKLKSLIENLFEISKMSSGKLQLNKSNVDILELVNQSIAEYSDTELYTDKNLAFVVRTFKDNIQIDLDGNRMSRVFENLINNALKYSVKNTRVFVEIDSIPKGIKLSFKNTSFTALDFDKEEIFERFTRGDASRNSNISGNGLGLAIAKSIIELHGGIMYIDFDGDLFKCIIELYY